MRRRSIFIGIGILAIVLVVAIFRMSGSDGRGEGSAGRGQRAGGPTPPVSVVAVEAAKKDVPVYLDGLGTVQAYKTVTVRSRVDGELVAVNFREGQDVKVGDVLARIDPRTYQAQFDQAVAQRDKDQAQLELAGKDLERYLSLKDRVTGQSVDTQRALVRQLEATVRADRAAVENARTMLGYTTILSPINGRTGIRLVDEGNIVHASDTTGLVVLTQLQPISVMFTLPQQTLPQIMRQNGPLPVVAVQADGRTVIDRGMLELVDNQIDTSTGTIKLKAQLPNKDRQLWPGGFVNTRLLVDTVHDGIVIPAPAVQRGPQGTYAFVVKQDQTVEMRPLTIAQFDSGEALVASGLAPGEKVVTEGAGKLKEGAKVARAQQPKKGTALSETEGTQGTAP